MKKAEVNVRFAGPEDAENFASWAAWNDGIPAADKASVAKAHPMILVVEVNGQPEMYLPLIPAVTIGFLDFRPGQDIRTRATCLREMREALERFQQALKIEYAYVHTRGEYPLGRWATKNGFTEAPDSAFRLERS